MNISLDVVDRVRIASPCPMRWDDLEGAGPVRHCRRCRLDVYNLSDMTRADAAQVIASHEGQRLCATFYRRPDGTVMTRDCPVGVREVRRRVARTLGRVAAALGLLLSGSLVLGRPGFGRLRAIQPFAAICERLAPTPVPPAPPFGSMALGRMMIRTPPATGTVPAPDAPTCGGAVEPEV